LQLAKTSFSKAENLYVNESNAAGKTAEAWNGGIGYHFSTDKYIDLPAWLNRYVLKSNEQRTTTIT
jgi:hypothetical protein